MPRSASPPKAASGSTCAASTPHDVESLQRGARTFVNYCLNCHSASYMRYNRLTDLGLTERRSGTTSMFTDDKIGDR